MIKQFYFKQFSLVCQSKLNGSMYCYVSPTIQLNISYLFAYSLNVKTVLFDP